MASESESYCRPFVLNHLIQNQKMGIKYLSNVDMNFVLLVLFLN